MKKVNIANYLKMGILFFGISLLLFNCEKEEGIGVSESVDLTQKLESRRISLDEFKEKNTNTKAFEKIVGNLDVSNTYLSKNSSKDGKLIVLTDEIAEVKKNNITTYTFRIQKTDFSTKDFQNLMIHKYQNDSIKLAILSYTYSEEEQELPYHVKYKKVTSENLENYNNLLSYLSKQTVNGINITVGDCVDISYSCPAGGTGFHHPEQCGAGVGTNQYFLDFSGCDLGGGGSPNSGGDIDLGGGSTGGSGSDGNSGEPNPHGGSTGGSGSNGNGGTGEILTTFDDFEAFTLSLTLEQKDWLNLFDQRAVKFQIENFLEDNNYSEITREFAIAAIIALMNEDFIDFNFILNNRTYLDSEETGDLDNNIIGGEDNTQYLDFNPQLQTWPEINQIINITDFVGWNRALYPTWQCMEYSKAQIAKKGYQISNYFNNTGQTIQIYKDITGVNQTELKKGLSYLKYALEEGIPVIVGVDNHAGSPNPNTDNTTDHFVVIVGMGIDSNGKYFQFFDNASGKQPFQNYGANPNNKLYYDDSSGIISGVSNTPYFDSVNVEYNYILTQIRKSKSL